jgi:hypothetical protein
VTAIVNIVTHLHCGILPVKQMRQMSFRLLACLAFQALCGVCMHAQDVSDHTPVLRRGSDLVLVPTFVKTSKGEPVFGLTANDFIVTDDGIEQQVSLEEIPTVSR